MSLNQVQSTEGQVDLAVAIVGSVGRGRSFRRGLEAAGCRIVAVCDTNEAELSKSVEQLGARKGYASYEELLGDAAVQAVIIGTPMHLHVPQAIAALQRGWHVLSEVPAAVSMDQARQLVEACRASEGIYMLAENYIYMKHNMIVRQMARQGLFGQVYYAEGEYIHELKERNELTPWRRVWQTGIAGVTYGTHSLGPILQWLGNDTVEQVCCADTDHRLADPHGQPYANTTPIMLCKTRAGALLKIRVDMVSDRPHAMTNYQLQGTDGCYESSRSRGDGSSVWLRSLSAQPRWIGVDDLVAMDQHTEQFVPKMWREIPPEGEQAGHGGGDYLQILDFVRAVRGEMPSPIGIHEAMDMTLPGLVSQDSIAQQGIWLPVPDSRDW